MSGTRFITALAAAVAIAGCSAEKADPPRGARVDVKVDALTTAYSITRLALDVQPANIQQDLVYDGPSGSFRGVLLLPVGLQTITARAYSADQEVGVGSASVEVVGGATASVSITIYDTTGPAPLPDHAPVITSLVAPNTRILVDEPVALAATVVDPDGDAIAYSWTQSCGTGSFSNPGAPVTKWSSPVAGTCTLTLLAEANGLHDEASVTIVVLDGSVGEVDVTGTFVPNPTLQTVSVSSSRTYAYIYRWQSDVMAGTVPMGSAVSVGVSWDLNTWTPVGLVGAGLRDDCGGTAVLNYAYDGYASFTWTPPLTPAACVLTASVDHAGLTDAMPVVVAVAPCSADLQCDYSAVCSDGVCSAPRYVSGWRQTTWWQNGGATTLPSPGAGSLIVEALVPDRNGNLLSYPGYSYSDGWFSVPGVPTGRYLLSIQTRAGSPRTLVDTTADYLDLGRDQIGRPDPAFGQNGTPVTFTIDGLEPWRGGDQLQVTSANAAVWEVPSDHWGILEGASQVTATEEWWPTHLVDANLGDDFWIHQLAQRDVPSVPGLTYRSAAQAAQVPGVVFVDGAPATVNATLAPVPQTRLADADWRTSEFERYFADMGPLGTQPAYHWMYVDATPGSVEYPAPTMWYGTPDVLSMNVAPGTPDLVTGPMPYGDPFVGWNEFRAAAFYSSTLFELPGATAPAELGGAVIAFDALTGSSPKLAPRTSPVRAPTISGLDLTGGPVAGVGMQPILSWTEPETGPADRYAVRVWEVVVDYDGAAWPYLVGTIYTRNTSVPLPLSFEPGGHYVATIAAYKHPSFTVEAPYRTSYTYAYASRVTAMWTP